MIRRMLASRQARKLRRNKLALVAIVISGLYLSLGLAVALFGVITLEDTEVRVGPSSLPGFSGERSAETRVEHVDFYLQLFGRALRRDNPEVALAEFDGVAFREIAVNAETLRTKIDDANVILRGFDDVENLDQSPERWAEIDQLESIVESVFVTPAGFQGFLHDLRMFLGTDRQGRSIALRGLYSVKVAIQIGLVVAVLAVLIGSLLGCAAGFFGGWVDHAVIFLYSTFSSIPNLVLLTLLAFAFTGSAMESTLIPVYVAFGATYWIGPCRVIRGETLKLRELEYVQAATAIGYGRLRIMLRHVIPNAAHLMFVNFSLLFVAAIKGEVILSFLNLGVKKGPSWGIMISYSQPEVHNGFYWQIGTATALMFGLVLSFNILTDALQDAFDPKHAG
ncbi:MAG: ABC transporter permease [Planctomycetota bacterium]